MIAEEYYENKLKRKLKFQIEGNIQTQQSFGFEGNMGMSSLEATASSIMCALRSTFLPSGYPQSVRPEYLEFQCWDSFQGLTSYLRSCLTTQALLKGAGVGDANASVVSATIAWICRDGIGMLTSLSIAYGYAHTFEADAGAWRLCADTLNNIGLFCNMLVSIYPTHYMTLGCLSAMCFSCCGLIAGATKARISAHFVIKNVGSLADITAKESTQETAVTLIGLLLGLLFTGWIGNDLFQAWIVFLSLTCIHQYANYKLIKVLVFDSLNPQRCYLIVNLLLERGFDFTGDDHHKSLVAGVDTSVTMISNKELLYRPIYLYWWGPQIGVSIECVVNTMEVRSKINADSKRDDGVLLGFNDLLDAWKSESFVIGIDRWNRICVCIEHKEITGKDESALKSYFIACYLQYVWNQYRNGLMKDDTAKCVDFYDFLLKPDPNMNFDSNSDSNLNNIPTRIREALMWYDSILIPKLIEYNWDIENSYSCTYNQKYTYLFHNKSN